MGNAYGKSALSASFMTPNFDKYLEKIKTVGNNVDGACVKAVDACLPIIEGPMIIGAERHRDNGDVVDAIEITEAKQTGNYIVGTVGIDMRKHPEAIHAVYQEYGDGHSPEFPDPFVRPAFDDNRNEIKRIQRAVLKKEGVPIE